MFRSWARLERLPLVASAVLRWRLLQLAAAAYRRVLALLQLAVPEPVAAAPVSPLAAAG